MNLIDGHQLAATWQKKLRVTLAKENLGTVAIVQVGEDPASLSYIQRKVALFKECGVHCRVEQLPGGITTNQLVEQCVLLNHDPEIVGYIVQLPLPKDIDTLAVLNVIEPAKDLDGLTPLNQGRLWEYQHYGEHSIAHYLDLLQTKVFPFAIPATAVGILYALQHLRYSLKGKEMVIINKSPLVGSPLAAISLALGAQVTVVSTREKNISSVLKRAHVVCTAVGKPQWLTSEMVPHAEVIFDIGFSHHQGKISGDVQTASFTHRKTHISPVPGGVGPLTVTGLLHNFVRILV